MTKIYYHATPADWRKEKKYRFLDEAGSLLGVEWRELTPDAKNNWLTEGMRDEFDSLISIGNKEAKASKGPDAKVVFKMYSRGVATSRDSWAYSFSQSEVAKNISRTAEVYNEVLHRWHKTPSKDDVDKFIERESSEISWSRDLKVDLKRGREAEFSVKRIRDSNYRPFVFQYLYFDRVLNEEVYAFPLILPSEEAENQLICVGGYGRKSFSVLAAKNICDLNFYGDPQNSFPFYIYNEDGTDRRENITDWALEQFRDHYKDASITKWDIFYYTYALLHHPEYREKYAANLKRELPRIPFAPDFWGFAKAGKELADIHVNYEDQPEYKLEMVENGKLALDWRVERMKYNKDKTAIVYNEFLTIDGIPPEVHEYRLGNRSALDWIVDQYKVSTDKRSGIVNDPNREDDPQYIVRLIKKIVTVSLRTNEIVNALPAISE